VLIPREPAADDAPDMMSRVLERDRVKNGRRPPEPEHITNLQAAHITMHEAISEYEQPRTQEGSSEEARTETQADAKTPEPQRSRAAIRAGAQKRAQQMASSPAIPITLRLPTELNDFLDESAHALRKKGVKKQDLVSRAVQLLVVALAEEEGGE
jgi:hypothetical protein